MFRPSGLPWTSKNVPLEPKAFVKIKPLAIQSQKGYKVKTRSEQRYSCADRSREVIFKENYQRRQYQVSRCGYWSDNSKPYRPVGELELDTRKLIIKTLGQQDIITQEQEKNAMLEEENRRTIKRRERKAIFKYKGLIDKQEPYCRIAELIIKKEVNEGRKRMAVVKSGSNFFQVIEAEQKDKDTAAQQEKTPTYSKQNWRPACHSDSESELDEPPGPCEPTQAWEEQQQHGYWAHLGLNSTPAPVERGGSSKSRNSIIPNSVYFVSNSSSVVSTQLQVLRWFLEAMRSDTPSSMSPLTSAWSCKSHDQVSSLESKKITQARWKSFVKTKWPAANTRPKSAATSTLYPISRAATSDTTDRVSDEEAREESPEPKEEPIITKQPASTAKPSSVKPNNPNSAVVKPTKPSSASAKPNKPNSASVKSKPGPVQLKRPSTSPGALTTASVLSPTLMREKFCQVAESKAQSLTRQLKAMERSRSTACRKKFSSLELTGVLTRDLSDMRASVALDTDDTARRKVMYNSHWFEDLLQDLISEVREEPKYLVPLQKLHALSQLQLAQKRFTKDRFLAVLLTLREWEMSLPVVANVIKFVCDRIIFLPTVEYNEWYAAHFNR